MYVLLTFENFKIIIYIILNQNFTSKYKFRVETETYIYGGENNLKFF